MRKSTKTKTKQRLYYRDYCHSCVEYLRYCQPECKYATTSERCEDYIAYNDPRFDTEFDLSTDKRQLEMD